MKNLSKMIYAGLWVLVLMLIISCAFPFQRVETVKLSDISGQLEYDEISRQAFIGGSLLYNPDQLSSGHLVSGVHAAVRLGKVDRDDTIPGQPSFTDRAGDARYGYITVNTIDASFISFNYTQYDTTGNYAKTSAHGLSLNETADINGDGIPDVTYSAPVKKRPGMERAVYLTFLSSQEMLNTTMFAVLPEQYSRGAYPNGLFGINPDGRFIVTKYEHENSAVRSAVTGLVYGDYVLDYQTGNYQRMTGAGNYRSARSVDDSDLTDLSFSYKVDLYFIAEEFNGTLKAENLFRALPAAVQNRYNPENFSNEILIPILNRILESHDLIETVAAVRDTGLTEAELTEIRDGIHLIAFDELVQINRFFLNDIYPEVCPELQTNSGDVAFILPLLHVVIRGEAGFENEDISRNAAGNYSSYITRRNTICSNFSKYKVLGSIDPRILFPNKDDGKQTNSTVADIRFGVYGKVENNWGSSIKMEISAAVLLQLEWTQMNPALSITKKSLLDKPLSIADISIASFYIGPVLVEITCPIKFDIDLLVNGKPGFTSACFMGFTGLYGAGVNTGANYGIGWKKVLIIDVPYPYFTPYFNAETTSDFAYYAGPIDSSLTALLAAVTGKEMNNYSSTVELTPKITFNPQVSALKLVSAGFAIDTGLTGKFMISALPGADQLLAQKKLPVTGSASLHYVASAYASGRVGIDTTVLGIRINFGKDFASQSLGIINKQIGSTVKVF